MRAGGVWRSLVARLLWEQEVGGSNPLTPTIPLNLRSRLQAVTRTIRGSRIRTSFSGSLSCSPSRLRDGKAGARRAGAPARRGGAVLRLVPPRPLAPTNPLNPGAIGPNLSFGLDTRASGSKIGAENAGIAQLVEHNLAKVGVASSNLVSRSILHEPRRAGVFCGWCIEPRIGTLGADTEGQMAEWLCSGLQSRVRRFDSDSGLQ